MKGIYTEPMSHGALKRSHHWPRSIGSKRPLHRIRTDRAPSGGRPTCGN